LSIKEKNDLHRIFEKLTNFFYMKENKNTIKPFIEILNKQKKIGIKKFFFLSLLTSISMNTLTYANDIIQQPTSPISPSMQEDIQQTNNTIPPWLTELKKLTVLPTENITNNITNTVSNISPEEFDESVKKVFSLNDIDNSFTFNGKTNY
jgi:hypothetical protein